MKKPDLWFSGALCLALCAVSSGDWFPAFPWCSIVLALLAGGAFWHGLVLAAPEKAGEKQREQMDALLKAVETLETQRRERGQHILEEHQKALAQAAQDTEKQTNALLEELRKQGNCILEHSQEHSDALLEEVRKQSNALQKELKAVQEQASALLEEARKQSSALQKELKAVQGQAGALLEETREQGGALQKELETMQGQTNLQYTELQDWNRKATIQSKEHLKKLDDLLSTITETAQHTAEDNGGFYEILAEISDMLKALTETFPPEFKDQLDQNARALKDAVSKLPRKLDEVSHGFSVQGEETSKTIEELGALLRNESQKQQKWTDNLMKQYAAATEQDIRILSTIAGKK